MYRVITTVGTSLITNYCDEEVRNVEGYVSILQDLEELESLNANIVLEGKNFVVRKLEKRLNDYWIKGLRKDKEGNWCKADEYNKDCCAEIKTLLEFYRQEKAKRNKDFEMEVYLISTDTPASALAAKLIKENISNFNENIKFLDIFVAEGLQTEDCKRFQKVGIDKLFEYIDDKILKKENEDNIFDKVKTVINISGGYKALIPYMTIFAQIYDLECIYIYEESDSLITIPPLPIQIDWAFVEEYYPYLTDPNLYKGNKKLDYLVEKGLIRREGQNYSWTSLGKLFIKVIDAELHVSRNVMGFFFEYKLYEYYINNVYQGKYKVVNHSELIKKDERNPRRNVEIDLVLRAGKNSKDYIAIEVKSLLILNEKNIGKLKNQMEKHIRTMKEVGYPKEYHLCMYTPNERMFQNLYNDQISRIKELSKIFENTPIKFKVFLVKANYDQVFDQFMKNANPYQQLMKDKLEYGYNFKEIDY